MKMKLTMLFTHYNNKKLVIHWCEWESNFRPLGSTSKPLISPTLNLQIVHGKMQYVFDYTGKRYLDALSGVNISCGHSHGKLLNATPEYLHLVHYGEALASKMPRNLKVVYFVNPAAEAKDFALIMTHSYSGNSEMVALQNPYHGGSSPTSLQSLKLGKVHRVMNPDPYREIFGLGASRHADDLQHHITYATTTRRVASFTAETIQSLEM